MLRPRPAGPRAGPGHHHPAAVHRSQASTSTRDHRHRGSSVPWIHVSGRRTR